MPPAALTKREQNKAEKRGRIIAASRALFAHKGFDATTTQEIADAASVSAGTVFLYAKTKEDLLILVFQEEMTSVVESGFRAASGRDGLVDQLQTFFEALVIYHERDLSLARALMRKLAYVDNAEQRSAVGELMNNINRKLALLVERAKTSDEVSADVPLLLAARSIFAVYYLQLGALLSGYIDRQQFDRSLRGHVELLLRGLRGP